MKKLKLQDFKILDNGHLDLLYGSDELRKNVLNNLSMDDLILNWVHESNQFMLDSYKYKIYTP